MLLEEPLFFVTGGTLQQGAPSYVVRQADTDLLDYLCRCEFCYVLNSRQMGKSSLMVRTAQRLRQLGSRVAILDLTAIGQNLTPEQWYDGMLAQLGRQLDLEDELEDFYAEHGHLGPWDRWRHAVTRMALDRQTIPTNPGHPSLVIFVDEIDVVRSLPFSADEFFAGIRHCYTGRATDASLARLAFCLLGTATPTDLIADTRLSPFNIGYRIEMRDFTPEEAAPLGRGLGSRGAALLKRVFHWTNGHPYLTQRLCRAVAERAGQTPADVDAACDLLFLSRRARETDDNLMYVRNRLLKNEVGPGALLSLYGRIRTGRKSVRHDDTSLLLNVLRLCGIVQSDGDLVLLRNRIYEQVFDRDWIRNNMPDAELRRQRQLAREEANRRKQAEKREMATRNMLYAAEMNLAQQAWENGNLARSRELLDRQLPHEGQTDLRGWEWRYLSRICRDESLRAFHGHKGRVYAAVLSPDGATLATAGRDRTVRLWSVGSGTLSVCFVSHMDEVRALAFHPSGALLASASQDRMVKLWDIAARCEAATLRGHSDQVLTVAFSPDGRLMASGGADKTVLVWEVESRRNIGALEGYGGTIHSIAFTPDGEMLAVAGRETNVTRFWNVRTQEQTQPFAAHRGYVFSLAFTSDGSRLFTRGTDNLVKAWDLDSGKELSAFPGSTGFLGGLAVAPDGSYIATANEDNTMRLWDSRTGIQTDILRGHTAPVMSVTFSTDGTHAASAGDDGTARLWAVARRDASTLCVNDQWQSSLAFSPDGRHLAVGANIGLWNVETGTMAASVRAGTLAYVTDLAFLSSELLLSAGQDGSLRLWKTPDLSPCGPELRIGSGWINVTARNGLVAACTKDGCFLWRPGEAVEPLPDSSCDGACDFSPDGARLAIGGGTVTLWDTSRRRLAHVFRDRTERTPAVAFSPDGSQLALGGEDKLIRLWDIDSMRPVADLSGHAGPIWSLAYAPGKASARRLASGSVDGTIKLWNVETFQEVLTLRGHTGPITRVAFSPDGATLASCSGDGTVRLWRA